ncbi:hypothetical protein BDA99DRAFT_518226 [Phascolomyces articulosus]|uniref:Uncharacterized protein n=1 Tax=Phascolomyces articulosus TaxID=60185 RepID=A0AAD5JUQ3_9FUNG|nr:hypothetical protein BDA99DRAFT_518226 [Phascolomyces articulosus]
MVTFHSTICNLAVVAVGLLMISGFSTVLAQGERSPPSSLECPVPWETTFCCAYVMDRVPKGDVIIDVPNIDECTYYGPPSREKLTEKMFQKCCEDHSG